ncbi:MAG: phosphate ABC transporter permease subunit PstC [Lachnospirales bacterium]
MGRFTIKNSCTKEKIAEYVFLLMASISILAILVICLFLLKDGLPGILEIGPINFLFGSSWKPSNIPAEFGILPMILGSIYVTLGALIIGVPIGILTAIFMAKFCPSKIKSQVKSIISILSGIPSVVYGFFGMVVIVPMIREYFPGNGNSMLTASILLGIMILPTIIELSTSAIDAVPTSYYEGALALGATHEESTFFVVVPAAYSGIMASIVLGMGRAIGETMAVVMVAGNQTILRAPWEIFKGTRTLTSNIIMEMGYASGLHSDALISTGLILFIFILVINMSFNVIKRRLKQ